MRLVLCFVLVAACGDNRSNVDAKVGDGPADVATDGNQLTPDTLFGTGLCVDKACTQISADVHAYTPRFGLWADTAAKRRWIYLPPGNQIDTTDMDHWVFPQGTKFWKEFTRGAVRVETRYIVKVGPGNTVNDWFYVAYQWNATEDDTIAVPSGVVNANGTAHDIPPRYLCKNCHENFQPTRILGFGAIQLDFANATAGEIDLDHAVTSALLTTNPPGASSPHYPLPGTSTDQAALGYMHANCGHCHNPTSNVFLSNNVTMFLRLDVGALSAVNATPAYTTAVNQDPKFGIGSGTKLIVPMDLVNSIVIIRFESTNPAVWMPAAGHKTMDPTGDAALRAWIAGLI